MAINLSLKQIKAKVKWNNGIYGGYTNRFSRFYFSYFRGKEEAEVNALLENSSNFGTIIYIMVFNGSENYWST